MEEWTARFLTLTWLICGAGFALIYTELRNSKNKAHLIVNKGAIASKLDDFFAKHGAHLYIALVFIVTAAAFVARLYRLGEIPWGLNQDEASIGYDSFAIGHFGYDRNGFRFPVYPIGFGNGHGPLYTYLSIPAIRLLGLSIFSVRITNALLSCAAVVLSYFLVLRITKSRMAALLGLFFTATAPTLVIAARWALDGSPPPALFIIALYFLVCSIESRKTLNYALSAAFFALICYSYGPTAVVVLIFLGLFCPYLLYHKKITLKQLLISGGAFAVVIAPVVIFMARNVLGLPAGNTHGLLTFPVFTANRADTIFLGSFDADNFIAGFNRIVFQREWDFIWNQLPGFGTTFIFTAPLITAGLVLVVIHLFKSFRAKEFDYKFMLLSYFVASFVLAGLIHQNVNRLSVVYPAIVLLIIVAVYEIGKRGRLLAVALCAFTLISFGGFSTDYFGETHRQHFGRAFFYSFGDAIEFAMEQTDGTIYVTERYKNMPGILTLFYAQLPPQQYFNTVVYRNPDGEFRWEASFDRFIFGTPYYKDAHAVYLVDHSEVGYFDPNLFNRKEFTYYSVMYPRG